MTKAQMRKYLADAQAVRDAAKEKLPNQEQVEKERLKALREIEEKLDDVF
jgi:hypothetical protein